MTAATLHPREIARLCWSAGWKNADELLIAVSVALAESNGRPAARHVNANGSTDRGLWQINDKAHPEVSDAAAFDPVRASAWARQIFTVRSNSFRPWAAFNNGAYKAPTAMGYALDGLRNFLAERHGFPIT